MKSKIKLDGKTIDEVKKVLIERFSHYKRFVESKEVFEND